MRTLYLTVFHKDADRTWSIQYKTKYIKHDKVLGPGANRGGGGLNNIIVRIPQKKLNFYEAVVAFKNYLYKKKTIHDFRITG